MTKPDPFRYFKTSREIIRLAVMLYVRFPLSLRNVEDLLHERGIEVSHESVRYWWHRFGPMFASEIRKRRIAGMNSSKWRWHLDEMFVKINGERHYLWRAVDHEGEVLESFVTKTRDKKAALKFLKKSMKRHGRPHVFVTDKLRSYSAALREIGMADRQETGRWLNNRAENSHLPFRRRERAMLRFRRMRSLQKFAAVHASVYNHFNQERSLSTRTNFKLNRAAALAEWRGLCAGWRWHLDEMFVKINGEMHYLWRAVDHEGEVLESYVTRSRDKKAALKFLRKAMRKHGRPEAIVTDRLRSYGAALKEIGADNRQDTGRWKNNRAENSHLPFRRRERAMLRFRRMRSLQKFAAVHASVYNPFNQERSLSTRTNFKLNRAAALSEWRGLCVE